MIVAGALGAAILAIALIALASGSSSPSAPAHVSRVRSATTVPAKAKAPAVRKTATSTSTAPPAAGAASTGTTTTGAPMTVSGAAGTLDALIAQDVHAGTITPPAGQQLEVGLASVVNSWQMSKAADAQRQLADLTRRVSTLEQGGQIAAAAVPALGASLAELRTALASSSPPTQATNPGPGQGPKPGESPRHGGTAPGHGGIPPGQAKKSRGGENGDSQGD